MISDAMHGNEVYRLQTKLFSALDDFKSWNEFQPSSYDSPDHCPTKDEIDLIQFRALIEVTRVVCAGSIYGDLLTQLNIISQKLPDAL